MRSLDPTVVVPKIRESNDVAWLQGFRARIADRSEPVVVAAIDDRLMQLAIGAAKSGLSLEQRVDESLRVHEAFLRRKHGRRQAAVRTRDMIRRLGAQEAVQRTVTDQDTSSALELLAQHGRLDCAYESIVLDFPDRFDAAVHAKAAANLARVQAAG